MNTNVTKASFANIADINNGHSLVFPEVDPIVKDILSRDTQIRSRIQSKPEGLETFRWVEQTGLARNAAFSDPRAIAPTAPNAPTRVEKLAKIKCITSRITYGFFDSALTRNGTFGYILEQDMRDAVADCLGVSNAAIYNGTDTSYGTPTTNQYYGIMSAITQTATFNTTETLAEQIGTEIARMINKKFGNLFCNLCHNIIFLIFSYYISYFTYLNASSSASIRSSTFSVPMLNLIVEG